MDIKLIIFYNNWRIGEGRFLMGSWELCCFVFFGQEYRLYLAWSKYSYQYSGLKIYFEGVRINIS